MDWDRFDGQRCSEGKTCSQFQSNMRQTRLVTSGVTVGGCKIQLIWLPLAISRLLTLGWRWLTSTQPHTTDGYCTSNTDLTCLLNCFLLNLFEQCIISFANPQGNLLAVCLFQCSVSHIGLELSSAATWYGRKHQLDIPSMSWAVSFANSFACEESGVFWLRCWMHRNRL